MQDYEAYTVHIIKVKLSVCVRVTVKWTPYLATPLSIHHRHCIINYARNIIATPPFLNYRRNML